MPVERSKSVHFDSWKELLDRLPHLGESQLMTVFVWATDQEKVPPGDARFLKQVRTEAFEQLVARTKEPLRRYLIRRHRCRDVHQVDDIVQEVLIKVYLRAEQYDPSRSFWGWLYRIAYHKYIDILRRQKPGDIGTGRTGKADEELESWLHHVALTTTTPESAALAKESQKQVDDAISRLPALQQTIVRLRLDSVQGNEIAQRIGRSPAYVSQAYYEALEVIRSMVSDAS
jgi:RNA polymerase sigma factor (sigma-70 family)